jgi:hypothetical protein
MTDHWYYIDNIRSKSVMKHIKINYGSDWLGNRKVCYAFAIISCPKKNCSLGREEKNLPRIHIPNLTTLLPVSCTVLFSSTIKRGVLNKHSAEVPLQAILIWVIGSTTGKKIFAECQIFCRVFFFGHSAKICRVPFLDTRQR